MRFCHLIVIALGESTKLYVGNLAFQTTSEDLKELFAQAGTVESASVVEDRMTGRSRGFAFVEMSSKEEAASIKWQRSRRARTESQ
jgi:RNA recognition motif-containing protein